MGKLAGLLLFGLFFSVASQAQEIIFCLDHTDSGLPLGAANEFALDKHGSSLDIVYRQKEAITNEKLYFFIDILQDGKYSELDTKTATTNDKKSWTSVSYDFQRSGLYRVLVLDASKKEICRAEVRISLKEDENSPEYYVGSRLVFCESVTKGEPDSAYKVLRLPAGGSKSLAVFVQHLKPFKTRRLFVDVWKAAGKEQSQYVETMEFHVDPTWTYSQFHYLFASPGTYTFRIYNEDEIWMVTASLEVATR